MGNASEKCESLYVEEVFMAPSILISSLKQLNEIEGVFKCYIVWLIRNGRIIVLSMHANDVIIQIKSHLTRYHSNLYKVILKLFFMG